MSETIIRIDNVSFRHKNTDAESLTDISLDIRRGECVLLCGKSGSGKTTLSRLINGLVPHFYEGELSGTVNVCGMNVPEAELYETARHVGSVFQNPRSQFFCVDATSELAFGCENLGLPEEEIRKRIRATAQDIGISHLLEKNLFVLSGGEKQKVACGSVAAMEPDVFVLDEPTSNLDLTAIEDLRALLLKWKNAGKTIVIAEHRLYWTKALCDRVICMKEGRVDFDVPMEVFCRYGGVEFARMGLRDINEPAVMPKAINEDSKKLPDNTRKDKTTDHARGHLTLKRFHYAYDHQDAIRIDELEIPIGAVVAVTGKNGAGKSTFAHCLCGIQKRFQGIVEIPERRTWKRKQLLEKSYMVMQDVNHQLFCETVEEEVELGMRDENRERLHEVLEALQLSDLMDRHPMSISGGQKQRVAIASAVLAGKEVLVFDEPTSGLDYYHMMQTSKLLSSLMDTQTVFIITHDPALVRRCCTHILKLEEGRVMEYGEIDTCINDD